MYRAALLVTLLAAHAFAQISWSTDPFTPAAIPLAVKSPYVSAWLPQGAGAGLSGNWPTFRSGGILGWAGFVNVDGTSWRWMGDPIVPNTTFTNVRQTVVQLTATQTVFEMTAGPVDITVTFLSPVEPSDLVKQSLPMSYYSISAASNDGKPHSVQVYADISGEWVSAHTELAMNWTGPAASSDVFTHQASLANPTTFLEVDDRIHYGSAYHSTLNTQGATYQIGEDIVVRAQFLNNSKLLNTIDKQFRSISDRWPVLAFAKDFGTIMQSDAPAVFAVGHIRDPVVKYIILNNGVQEQSYYFMSNSSVDEAIKTFLEDYSNAQSRATALDAQIHADASEVSADYAAIAALSVRQAFAATEITVGKNFDGSYDTSNVLTFMREMSSKAVSTVDAIYAAWPLFLYITPSDIAKSLLLPLLQYQATGQYPRQWSLRDMGVYPSATGHNDGQDDDRAVEECGNMIIMALSYTQKTNDTSLMQYYPLFSQWGQFLEDNTLNLGNQERDADDFDGFVANRTNLALKGIIALKAMAQIANIAGHPNSSATWNDKADSYMQQWQALAVAPDKSHLMLSYGDQYNWGLMYNLYADKLLGMNFVPSDIYDMQTNWYGDRSTAYGLPFSSRHSAARSGRNPLSLIHARRTLELTFGAADWAMWTAATVTSSFVRDKFIGGVAKYAQDGTNSAPFGDLYDTANGSQVGVPNEGPYFGRVNVGGHFALLALPSASRATSSSGSSAGPASPTDGSNNGAVLLGLEGRAAVAVGAALLTSVVLGGTFTL
ncbi:DUF1793-domain-containing protein [Daedaleopsis nitida]|nr:DUF1793-domain-containing protein [Daedaleopsis nitida]